MENQAAGLFFIYRFLLSLQEGRLVAASQRRAFPNFNSRPCERGDSKIKQNMLCFFCNYREKLLTFRQHQLS